MAETLSTSNTEPGFYSQVRENANLQVPPSTVNVVAVIGAGKATDTYYADVTPVLSAGVRTLDYDALGTSITSFDGFNGTLSRDLSNFGFGLIGATGATAGGYYNVAGKTFSFEVADTTYEVGFTAGQTGVSLTGIVAAINGITGMSGATGAALAIATAGTTGYVQLVSKNASILTILDGNANSVLGFADFASSDIIYWHAKAPVTSYQVQFENPKTSFAPTYHYSSKSVQAAYGAATTVTNTLSLGADAVFIEGAGVVLCRLLDPVELAKGATQTMVEYEAALTDLEKYNCSVIVPMLPINTYPDVMMDTMSHVSTMSDKLNRKERTCILGVDETVDIIPTQGGTGDSWESIMETFTGINPTTGMQSNRVVVMSPGSAYVNGTLVNGTYLAACLAGRLMSFDEATPMTRKTFASVGGLYANIIDEKSRYEKNLLGGSFGVTVCEMNGTICTIRRAITANVSSIASQEISIVRAFDRIAAELRVLLEQQFVGTKISGSTSSFITSSATRYLNGMVDATIIGSFRGVSAVQNAQDPRQFDVSFEAVPIFPFLWGFIDISITLQ